MWLVTGSFKSGDHLHSSPGTGPQIQTHCNVSSSANENDLDALNPSSNDVESFCTSCKELTFALACSVEESGAESLAAFVRRSTDLQTFNLNMNDIGTQGISKVSLSFA